MDFKTKGSIVLRPGDERLNHSFNITNFIPSDTDATSVQCVILDEDSVSDIISYVLYGSATVSNNVISLNLSHSNLVDEGRYKIIFYIDIDADNSPQKVCVFDRLYIRNI